MYLETEKTLYYARTKVENTKRHIQADPTRQTDNEIPQTAFHPRPLNNPAPTRPPGLPPTAPQLAHWAQVLMCLFRLSSRMVEYVHPSRGQRCFTCLTPPLSAAARCSSSHLDLASRCRWRLFFSAVA